MTSATLPVSSLIGANLAWVRQDFGPMDALIQDIKEHGIRQPILIRPDYQVLDGARRLVAAASAKVQYAPIVQCHTWERFEENFRPAAPDAYPMTWIEIRDLLDLSLRPLYQDYRYRKANETRDRKRMHGDDGRTEKQRNGGYSHFVNATASLFGAEPLYMKMLADHTKRLANIKGTAPELYASMVATIQALPAARRPQLAYVRVLKTVLDRYLRGEDPADVTAKLFAEQMEIIGRTGGPSYAKKKRNLVNPTFPEIPVDVIANFVAMLETLGEQGEQWRNFKLLQPAQAAKLLDSFERTVLAISRLYRFRRRMESALAAYREHHPIPGEV
jgi:ParB-like nuclease domain